jgi:hypothetical protein
MDERALIPQDIVFVKLVLVNLTKSYRCTPISINTGKAKTFYMNTYVTLGYILSVTDIHE